MMKTETTGQRIVREWRAWMHSDEREGEPYESLHPDLARRIDDNPRATRTLILGAAFLGFLLGFTAGAVLL